MGHTQEFSSPISAARLFKAFVLESHVVMPKILPFIKSVEFIEGDGGIGSIKLTTITDNKGNLTFMKYRIDSLDKENFAYSYTVIEGDILGDKIEKIAYHVSFKASSSGSICKMTGEYHTVGDYVIKEEEVKTAQDRAAGVFKVVETYLLEHPDVYA